MSPTLFAIFINDLAKELKQSNIGIKFNYEHDTSVLVNVLLYADDIVLIAADEIELQSLIFIVETWCKKWRLELNLTKTNVMHIRGSHKKQSNFWFLFDHKPVPYCKTYKYLGKTIDQFLDFQATAEAQCESAGRALSAIITKIIKKLRISL